MNQLNLLGKLQADLFERFKELPSIEISITRTPQDSISEWEISVCVVKLNREKACANRIFTKGDWKPGLMDEVYKKIVEEIEG